jgi:hypothetical protein
LLALDALTCGNAHWRCIALHNYKMQHLILHVQTSPASVGARSTDLGAFDRAGAEDVGAQEVASLQRIPSLDEIEDA